MLKDNINFFISETAKPNPLGEKVTLVGATKTIDSAIISEAVSLGLTDIGENKAQDFRDKFEIIKNVNYHFFGRLQRNKVKYLIGKACLIQSMDTIPLAEEINDLSRKIGIVTDTLIEVNLGEEQKGGCPFDELDEFYKTALKYSHIRVVGLMSVLPYGLSEKKTEKLCLQCREKYDILRKTDDNFSVLSMGMTSDYKLAIKCGSNMIRIGEGIFGKRNYGEEQ